METFSFFSGQLYSLGSLNCGGSKQRARVHMLAEPVAALQIASSGWDSHPGLSQGAWTRQATGCLVSISNARPRWVAEVKLLEFVTLSSPILARPIINPRLGEACFLTLS